MMNYLRIKLSRKVQDLHDEIFLNYWEALNKCNGLSYLGKIQCHIVVNSLMYNFIVLKFNTIPTKY